MTSFKWLPIFGLILVGAQCRTLGSNTIQKKQTEVPEVPDDELETVTFSLGAENEDIEDATKVIYTGVTANRMITVVRIEAFYDEASDTNYLRCVGFTYGDQENNCPDEPEGVNDLYDFPLDAEEYITYASGDSYNNILSIYFETNKGGIIGPFGTGKDPSQHEFSASYNGAPLLYVDILHGLWLYSLNFTFHEYPVLDLFNKTNQLAEQVYNSIKTDIEELYTVRDGWQRMHPDIAKKGCLLLDTDPSPEVEICCDMEVLINQLNILTDASTALLSHSPRNLLELKDYDSSKYLDEVQEAKNFHNLITEIKFDLNTVIDVTEQQSAELSAFFSATAEFDQQIAEQDLLFIQGQLETKSAGAEEAASSCGARLTNIISVGISVAFMDVVEEAYTFGTVLAVNMNPFKWIFGGPDIDAILEALEELMEAIGNLVQFITLMVYLQDFIDYAYDIMAKLAENQAAIDAMAELVIILQNTTDILVIQQYAEEFINSYGAYSPSVSSQDIVYVVTLLDAIAQEACTTLADIEGMVSETAIIAYESSTLDCVYVFADVAVLGSYFEEVYTLQFEMIDALTSIVKGEISVAMADRIGSIETTIDVRTAAIGTAMVETTYQAASLGRCDILEYLAAGKRPGICETLLFTDDDIQKLIAYVGSESSSDRIDFAYIPTYPQADFDIPYINITRLLRGEYQTLRLPMADKTWMKEYDWLPSSYDPQTAFYVELLEIYLPALKCNETGESIHNVKVDMLTGNPTALYSEEAPPRYTVDQHIIQFEYNEPSSNCAGEVQNFPILDNETMTVMDERDVCVVSPGYVNETPLSTDFTYPSLFTTYTIQVTGHHDCTLVVDEDAYDFRPLITARYIVKQVFAKKNPDDQGLDECWPEDSRCPVGEFCVDEVLDYCCRDSQGVCD